MARILITGATGFIGQRLVARLVAGSDDRLVCLSLDNGIPKSLSGTDRIEWVEGDVRDPACYAEHLASADAVIHLAAATGKRPRDVYFDVNCDGTRTLVEQCRHAGVERFIHFSTIAVRFTRLSDYPYAESKKASEAIVADSGLAYTIVRPTIVLGRGGASWENLAGQVAKRIVPVFGSGHCRIQPIDVDDLVECIVTVLHNDESVGHVIELGGPEQSTWKAFLRTAHGRIVGGTFRCFHVPLWLLLPVLRCLERLVGHRLPATAGQFAVFRNDSIIEPNPVFEEHRDSMKSIEQMIDEARGPAVHGAGAVPNDRLLRECIVFSRYLIGRRPDDYITRKYCAAHDSGRPLDIECSAIERLLGLVARLHPWMTLATDTYCSFFLRSSVLRKKLVLLLAIMENSPTTHRCVELRRHRSGWLTWAGLIGRVAYSGVLLLLTACTIGPAHVCTAAASRLGRKGS